MQAVVIKQTVTIMQTVTLPFNVRRVVGWL
jgi:hypothetical protein